MLADLAARLPPPTPPGGCRLLARPAERTDLAEVQRLLDAAGEARGRPPALRREDLELRWLLLDDPRDALVVHAGGQLVAVAVATYDLGTGAGLNADPGPLPGRDRTVHLDLQVHPAWAGRGLGSWMVALAARLGDPGDDDGQAADAVPLRLRTALLDVSDEERAWFARRGFVARRHLLDLHLDLHAPPPAPRWPADIRPRPFAPGRDEHVLWSVHQRAFAELPTHLPLSREDLLASRQPAADPQLVLLAEHHGPAAEPEVVGVLVGRAGTEVAPTDGWVRDLAVLPAWRRRGIGMALLRTGFAAFRARGLTGVALEVDDVTLEGALPLYRRAGMRIVRRADVLERAG